MQDSAARPISDIAPRLDDDDVGPISQRFAAMLVTHALRALEAALAGSPANHPARALVDECAQWLVALECGERDALSDALVAARRSFARLLVTAKLGAPDDRALCAAVGRLAAALEVADRGCTMAEILRES